MSVRVCLCLCVFVRGREIERERRRERERERDKGGRVREVSAVGGERNRVCGFVWCVCARMRAGVRACVRACVYACVRACVRACVPQLAASQCARQHVCRMHVYSGHTSHRHRHRGLTRCSQLDVVSTPESPEPWLRRSFSPAPEPNPCRRYLPVVNSILSL